MTVQPHCSAQGHVQLGFEYLVGLGFHFCGYHRYGYQCLTALLMNFFFFFPVDVLRISLVQCELVTACPIVTHVSNSLPVFSLYSPEDSSRVFPLHLLFLGLTKPISLSQPFLACCVLQPSPCGCCAPGVISQVANRGEKSLHVLSMFLLTKCSVRVACAAVLYH